MFHLIGSELFAGSKTRGGSHKGKKQVFIYEVNCYFLLNVTALVQFL
ncbi:hypothetical protein DFQ12_1271 [Sphingobacterium detergens]|uniref:Uncharacterized protein n=1 Tax=Sphingobacterium detergens TaxID=1145106 RepID=A0A420BI77_SPHD1|nr:hypothetical protein DFQ12_1271 [Sphingobacterium detergens]